MAAPPARRAASLARVRFSPCLNTAIVAGGYLLSRVLGLGRDMIISAQFGTRPELDAYRATFGLLDLIYLVIAGGALGSAFIPVFAGFLAEKRAEDAWRLASAVLSWALIALLAACALIALLAEPLVALTVGSGFDAEKRALTVAILRVLLIQPVLLGMGGLAKATLESFDRFALPAIGANLYNVGIIVGALLSPWLGINGLVWGVAVGALLFLLVQIPGLYGVGARYMLNVERSVQSGAHRSPFSALHATLYAPGIGQVGRLLAPRLFGQSVWQCNMIAIASFASLLPTGAVAANGYALQLMLLPHGLIALSLGTVLFPRLARHYTTGDLVALRAEALGAFRGVLFLALPASALLGILRLPVLRALYERGQFDAQSTALTASALGGYVLGLAAFAGAEILVRAFYALRDTRTPVYVGVGAVVINITLGWTLLQLRPSLAVLALAFSAANTLEVAALLWLLGARLGRLGHQLWSAIGRMFIATLGFGATLLALLWLSQSALPFLGPGDTYRWPTDFLPLALWIAGAGGLGALVYAGLALLLGLPEMRMALERVIGVIVRGQRRRDG